MNSNEFSRRVFVGTTAAALLWPKSSACRATAATSPPIPAAGQPIAVGTNSQLFFDDKFVAASENVKIVMNPPAKRGPILKPDKPWEDFRFTSYFTVLDDAEHGVVRMYYSCFAVDQWNSPDDPWTNHAYLCYAESKDGISWEKPDLGIVEFNGSRKNNILMRSVVDGTVFIDPVAAPERRYKLLHTVGPHKGGLRVSYSADGKHFTTPEHAVSPWNPDSQQNAFYDSGLKKYVAYLRAFANHGIPAETRSVARVVLDDIEQPWKDVDPKIVFAADKNDPKEVDFYTNAAFKYPWADDAHFMFPAAYHHFDPRFGNDGLVDVSAAASRDDITWTRPDRGPYVPLGEKGEWDESFMMMGVGIVRRGDKLIQYYNGVDISHGGTRKQSKTSAQGRTRWGWMGAVEQRLDGFYSADASYAGGWLSTPLLRLDGKHLILNINTSSAGSARVAILDEKDQPIAGYTADNCDVIMTNNVRHAVTWNGKADIAALAGRTVRLRIAMRSAKLYALRFSADQPQQ